MELVLLACFAFSPHCEYIGLKWPHLTGHFVTDNIIAVF